jgi:CubicO group peptidase (beta-lactamase class C family)
MHAPARPRTLVLLAGALAFGPAHLSAQRWTLPAEGREQVDSVFAFIDRDAPGCAVGVVRDGILAYGRGYGLANLDWGVPITTSTVFDIGSVSKQFTATALALLELDGVLSLDDEVRTWIPELPDYGSPLTIGHLLNHTSGIRDYLTLQSLAGFEFANVFDELDGVELIVRQRALNFEPGSEYLYSNSGYLLLANVVRRATGKSLRAFLEERVFDPLGMAHTSIWDVNTEVLAERATGYSPGEGAWAIDHAWNFQMGGDGQVITSVEDLVKWDANFYEPAVGGPGLLERLHTRGVLNDGDTIEYALGLSVGEYRGQRRVSHGGAWAGFRAHLTRFPDQRTSIVVECNRGDANPGGYVDAVADVVLGDVLVEAERGDTGPEPESDEPVRLSPDQLGRWVGLYRRQDRPDYWRFEVRGDALYILTSDEAFPLSPRSETEFVLDRFGVRVSFRPATGAGPESVQVGSGLYHRRDPAEVTAGDRRGLEGTYWSPELAVRFQVSRSDGALWLRRPGREPERMMPGIPGEFEAGGIALRVRRSAGGAVTGLEIHAGRVTGLVLDKEER